MHAWSRSLLIISIFRTFKCWRPNQWIRRRFFVYFEDQYFIFITTWLYLAVKSLISSEILELSEMFAFSVENPFFRHNFDSFFPILNKMYIFFFAYLFPLLERILDLDQSFDTLEIAVNVTKRIDKKVGCSEVFVFR